MGLMDRNDDERVSPGEFGRATAKASRGLTMLQMMGEDGDHGSGGGPGDGSGGGPGGGSGGGGPSCGCILTIIVVIMAFALTYGFLSSLLWTQATCRGTQVAPADDPHRRLRTDPWLRTDPC